MHSRAQVSVEDMEYKWDDTVHKTSGGDIKCEGRGEIWIRGHNVFAGYYQVRL